MLFEEVSGCARKLEVRARAGGRVTCACIAPLSHHVKCTAAAAEPSTLCASCYLCWDLLGECAASDAEAHEEPVKYAHDRPAPSMEEQLGL